MTVKVIGAGFGRTGTLSLKFALEQLGFDKCYHMLEAHQHPEHIPIWTAAASGNEPDWHALFEGYQATVDWPSCNFWREQRRAFPDAKVILTRRDPDRWYASVMNTIWKFSNVPQRRIDPAAKPNSDMAFAVIWNGVFDGRMDDKEHVIGCYERHCAEVIEEVPADELLVYEPGDGWAPLCEFLDVPVPEADYPRVNSTEEFVDRWSKADRAANAPDKSQ